MSSLLGMTLSGRYRLEERIGAGGMSTVYRALDETLERSVAVKVMNREVSHDTDQLERFRREARAVAQLSHPNVVGVIDAGDDRGHPYIVFEFVEGETLKQRVRRLGRLPIAEAVAYAIEIASALGAAHARHIVHRDVKPQNVLIDDEGTAKVTDFGIARSLEEEGLTDDGRVLGTTDYVSPEQAMGQAVTGQSDLYSLGVVLYEMLTGELPFSAETQVAVAMKHVRESVPDVRNKRPEVSAALAAVVDTATAKHTKDRYADDQELIADLEELLALETQQPGGGVSGDVTVAIPALARGPRRPSQWSSHRRRISLAGVVLLLVLAGAGVWLSSPAHQGKGAGTHESSSGRISLCPSCASAYNPFGHGGTAQNDNLARLAVDGNPSTAWPTQTYFTGQLGKPGVGIYVVDKRGAAATRIVIDTSTPRFKAIIYGTTRQPDANSFADSDWHNLSGQIAVSVASGRAIDLTAGRRYSRFLVWITQLPPGGRSASVNEIQLYG